MNDLIESTPGRHALDEDAALTPIFSAVRRAVQPVPDEVYAFRRDPLTAPIPLQALVPAPAKPWDDAPREGRHHVDGS